MSALGYPEEVVVVAQMLTVQQAAERLHRSESYLFKLVAWRKIPHTKLGRRVRFDEDRLAEWLQEHAIEPVAPTAPRRHGRVA